MHFVGCPRPDGSLETAPRAGLLPHDLVAGGDERGATPTTWESYWDEDGRYLVRAVTPTGDAWFSLVDEGEGGEGRLARLTPRASRVIPMPEQSAARRLVFVGARRRASATGAASSSLVLVGRRPAAGSRRSYAR